MGAPMLNECVPKRSWHVQRTVFLVCFMNSTTLAQPRLRVSRQSGFSQWSGSDHYLQVPQAGPSRISPQMNASDVPYDDDDQATPRVAMRPQLDSFADATPSQSGATGSERLRAILAKEHESLQTSRRPSPPRRRHESMSDVESDFESPHATAAQSQHVQSLRELFSKVNEDITPRVRKPSRRRNSIDLSEVDDSPRVERVKEERAMHKGKRKVQTALRYLAILPPLPSMVLSKIN
ncbi:hypothetical protein PHLGIDRAFT_187045 [Phlebiopsis gigantea 11061_1 CR5-6]|uniref:Uncharacterized protein n=1 Tax=Phlebiopsis gigantea (strain 11061_1 CR5-6) TaxID=745531 RepID=A0A0C3NZR5_PHLG1|nr:hypothetical protein PHLGIDRAFT_187045 [Phlebiopsis gigantea 11061_1 CR5-6]